MTAPRRRRIVRSDDSGAVLVLALIVVTVVALVVGGLLSLSGTNLRTTVAMRDQAGTAATADGAAQAAINTLRLSSYNNNTASTTYPNCFGTGESGKTLLLPNLVPGSTGSAANSAAVRCDPDPNTGASGGLVPISAANKPDNAILTLGQVPGEDGLTIKALNNSIPFSVRGGVVSNSNIRVTNGSLQSTTSVQAHTGCAGTITAPTVTCTAATTPDPDYRPEVSSAPAYQAVPANAATSCPGKVVTFQPGYYDDASALSDLMSGKGSGACTGSVWWFMPGVYYFDFQNSGSHQWVVNDGQLVAGTPVDSAGTPRARPTNPVTVPGACASPLRSTTAGGVQFVFGGDSRLQLGGSADAEICGGYHADRPPIAVYGLKTGAATPTTVTGAAATAVTGTGFTPSGAPDLPTALGAAGDGSTVTWTAPGNNAPATLSLSSFLPGAGIPAGSRLSSATLRIVYSGGSRAAQRSVTVTPSSGAGAGTPITRSLDPAAPNGNTTQSLDLMSGLSTLVHDQGLAGLRVDYSTTMSSGGSEQIDAVLLDLTYTAPALRGETTAAVPGNCLAATDGQCAVIGTTESYKGRFVVQGTVYTPLAPIDLTLSNLTEQALRFGIVARSLSIKETGATTYAGPVVEIPDDSPGYGPGSTVVYLTVYVCAASPSCRTPEDTVGAPVGRLALRVRVHIHDPSGTPQPGSREMTVQTWAVQR